MSTIVPVPKKVKATELNYNRPVVLTSVIMKCFERQRHPKPTTIYRHCLNIFRDDTIAIALHNALSHLDKRNTTSGENKYLTH
jgi:hypothetical protein